MNAGKGDKRRPRVPSMTREEFERRWNKAFKKDKDEGKRK